jgi:biotin-dependent carboxylase-like uncharacterized protein
MSDEAAEVVSTGPLALLEDSGRPGYAHLGVTASGAADRASYAAANRLVGNRPGAACVEALLGGLEVKARQTLLVAVTGARASVFVTAGRDGSTAEQPTGTSVTLFAGDAIRLGAPWSGIRSYLAVRGGLDAERVLGSRSTDVLSALGPAPLRAGDLLRLAGEAGEWPAAAAIPPRLDERAGVLELRRGPRDDWFGDRGWDALLSTAWTVGPDSNRVGVRLAPADRRAGLERTRDGELQSEGMVAGAVQIPPNGEPVVFLRDHPVTGGYPVIGVVTAAGVDTAAQLKPGDSVRFRG